MERGSTPEPGAGAQTYRFGVFELRAGELRKQGVLIKVQDQPLRILSFLLQHPGEVVTRDQIRARLWDAGTWVDYENAINSAIRKLRDALSDHAENPRFVETMARRGYRFIAPVSTEQTNPAPRESFTPPESGEVPERLDERLSRKHLWGFGAVIVFAALAIAGGAWYSRGRADRNVPAPEESPLTTYPGTETSPSFSPNGTQVAFSWNGPNAEHAHIYVKVIGSPDLLQLTRGEADEYGPAFSPDGGTMSFFRVLGKRLLFVTESAIGGPERVVAELPFFECGAHQAFYCLSSTWLPDGRSAILPGLNKLSVETGEMKPLTNPQAGLFDRNPSLSPDGRTLAFARGAYSGTEIYLVGLDSEAKAKGPPRRLVARPQAGIRPAWTPDGKEVVFITGIQQFGSNIMKAPVEGDAAPVLLPYGKGQAWWGAGLAISPWHNRLAFGQIQIHSHLYRLPLSASGDASGPPAVFAPSTTYEANPQYSPDGKRVVFQSSRSGNSGIWMSDADGSNIVDLYARPGIHAGSPGWSPDGKNIAFDSNATGKWEIYIVRAAAGQPRMVRPGNGNSFIPAWTRDGKWIIFDSDRTGNLEIWKMPVSGGRAVQLTRKGGWVGLESPDGKWLFYTKGENGPLWKMPAAGGEEVIAVPSRIGRAEFVVTDQGVFFIEHNPDVSKRADIPGGTEIRFLRFSNNQVKKIASVGPLTEMGLTVSPDRRNILYTQKESGVDLMLLENFH